MIMQGPKIAVIGSGLGGFGASHRLRSEGIETVLYEKNHYHGGHTATHHMDGFVFDEPLEWLVDQFFPLFDIVEYFLPEDKKAAVDPDARLCQMLNPGHFIVVFQGNHVEAVSWLHGDKARDFVPLNELIDHAGKMQIRLSVGVVRQKHIFPLQIFPDACQSLADIRIQSRIREGDGPVVDVPIQQLGVS
jgi:hypothetical protein